MNYKALTLGAALGFVLALSHACGGAEKCDAASCPTGCCDSAGTCVTATTVVQCGTNGQACGTCATNQNCVAGVCTAPPTGGGADAGCGPDTNPNGCCSSTGVTQGGTANTSCGSGGVACQNCELLGSAYGCFDPDGTGPQLRSCRLADGGTPAFGGACTQTSECSTIGTGAVCKMTTSSGNAAYQGGYCSKPCASDAECGSTGFCVYVAPFGEAGALCFDTCVSGSDCRSGYACYDVGDPLLGMCWIAPFPESPVAPDFLVGTACTLDSDCQNDGGFPAGFCWRETEGGAATGFTGGYCMGDCTVADNCGATAICLGNTSFAFCADRCTSPDAGQSDCRANYVCEPYIIGLSDGGRTTATDGVCFPNCQNPGPACPTGQTCNASGYCR
jgi:hypothetical protein